MTRLALVTQLPCLKRPPEGFPVIAAELFRRLGYLNSLYRNTQHLRRRFEEGKDWVRWHPTDSHPLAVVHSMTIPTAHATLQRCHTTTAKASQESIKAWIDGHSSSCDAPDLKNEEGTVVEIRWDLLMPGGTPEGFPVCFDALWQACGYGKKSDAVYALKRDYTENETYCGVLRNRSDGLPGRPRTSYYLTLRAAKHFAMRAGTEEGDRVRDYFIRQEEIAQGVTKAQAPTHQLQLQPHLSPDLVVRQLVLEAQKLEMEDRRFQAQILASTLDALKALGQLPEDVEAAHRVRVAEIATGRAMPRLLPPAPAGEWLSPSEIADRLGVTANRVGRAITSCGLRGGDHSRKIMNTAKHSTRTVTSYLYDEEAVRQVEAQIRAWQAPT